MTVEGGGGIHFRRAWPVWSNLREHRVEIDINVLSGSLRIDVDGEPAVKRSGWKAGINAVEVPFDVDGRPCLLVVHHRYADPSGPDVDLYSDGRSLTTGALLETHRQEHRGQVPNLVRMLLIFVPLIGIPGLLRSETNATGSPGWVGIIIVAGVGSAAAGGLLATRWYRRSVDTPNRHLVGGGIVLGCYLAFFAVFVGVLALAR